MTQSLDYQLGQINAKLEAIDKRLEAGSERHAEIDGRLDRLELVEAKRGGTIAALAALAGVVGSALTLFVPFLVKKL